MRNGSARHVKTNIKNTKKQNVLPPLCEAESCYTCAHARTGYFSDTVHCIKRDTDVLKTSICDKFERRE